MAAGNARTVAQPGSKVNLGRIRNPETALLAEEVVSLAALVAYDLNGASGSGRQMPKPGPLVGTLGLFAVLSLIGSFSPGAARVVAAFGGLITLTAMIGGARGKGLTEVFQKLSGWLQGLAGSGSAS